MKKYYCKGCGQQLQVVYGKKFDTETGNRKQYYECPALTNIKQNYKHKWFVGKSERVEFNKHDSDVPFDEFPFWYDFSEGW